jgi:hypothetical protein
MNPSSLVPQTWSKGMELSLFFDPTNTWRGRGMPLKVSMDQEEEVEQCTCLEDQQT